MIASTQPPLVSCLCVTRGKPVKLRRAIECFLAQTYGNKELLLVYETDDPETARVAEQYRSHPGIFAHAISVSPKLSLGELRNLSIELCRGDYFCQWDDDDWYHVERIDTQYQAVIRTSQTAAVLTNWLMFDVAHNQAYFSHLRLWEGSILCRKDAFGGAVRYPALRRMEDTYFLNELIARCGVYPLVAPTLYIYEVHAGNTWNRRHFDLMFAASQPLPAGASQCVAEILAGRYTPQQASELLSSSEFVRELKYFHINNVLPPNWKLERYCERMESFETAKAG